MYAWGRAEKRRGARLLVIDNTRHIRLPSGASRIDHMAEISVRMKQLRDDTRLPVVVCHHSMIDKKTGKEDVSWSSDVRRDADMLIFLREDESRTRTPTAYGDAGVYCINYDVEKNREGRKDLCVPLQFVKQHQLFRGWV